jgi:hypothetical protein
MPDGEWAVHATTELFESSEEPPYDPAGMVMRIRNISDTDIHILWDKAFAEQKDRIVLNALYL